MFVQDDCAAGLIRFVRVSFQQVLFRNATAKPLRAEGETAARMSGFSGGSAAPRPRTRKPSQRAAGPMETMRTGITSKVATERTVKRAAASAAKPGTSGKQLSGEERIKLSKMQAENAKVATLLTENRQLLRQNTRLREKVEQLRSTLDRGFEHPNAQKHKTV